MQNHKDIMNSLCNSYLTKLVLQLILLQAFDIHKPNPEHFIQLKILAQFIRILSEQRREYVSEDLAIDLKQISPHFINDADCTHTALPVGLVLQVLYAMNCFL